MQKTSIKLAMALFTIFSASAYAAPAADMPNNPPPAQVQKDQVPDSTSSGNYLETQPDGNGVKNQDKKMDKKHNGNTSKPTNLERSKRMTETPENGGTNVNQ